MPLTGYQDWERVSLQSGNNVLTVSQAITTEVFFELSNLSGFQSLIFIAYLPVGADLYSVQFTWYTDDTFSQPLTTNSFIMASNGSPFMCVPVQTAWLVIFIKPFAGGNNAIINCDVYGTQQFSTAYQMATFSTPTIHDNSSYAINQTKNFFTFQYITGRALLHISAPTNVTAQCTVNYLDFGTNTYIPYIKTPKLAAAVPFSQEIPVLATQLRVDVVNGAAAVQTILTTLTMLP